MCLCGPAFLARFNKATMTFYEFSTLFFAFANRHVPRLRARALAHAHAHNARSPHLTHSAFGPRPLAPPAPQCRTTSGVHCLFVWLEPQRSLRSLASNELSLSMCAWIYVCVWVGVLRGCVCVRLCRLLLHKGVFQSSLISDFIYN